MHCSASCTLTSRVGEQSTLKDGAAMYTLKECTQQLQQHRCKLFIQYTTLICGIGVYMHGGPYMLHTGIVV